MFAAAPILCTVIFGEEFQDSVGDAPHPRRRLARQSRRSSSSVARSSRVGSPGLQSLAIGAGFVCSVVLDILLIPPFGGTGAAVAAALRAHGRRASSSRRSSSARWERGRPTSCRAAGDLAWFVHRLRKRFGAGGRIAARVRRTPDAGPADSHPDPVRDVEDHESRDHARQQAPLLSGRADGAHAEDEGAGEP